AETRAAREPRGRPDRDARRARHRDRADRARCAARRLLRTRARQTMSYDPTSVEGIPEAGRERLRRMRESGRFFTSDLSVNEFLLVKQAGFEPLGLVVVARSTTSACS